MITITRKYSDRTCTNNYATLKEAQEAIKHFLDCQRGPGSFILEMLVEFGSAKYD